MCYRDKCTPKLYSAMNKMNPVRLIRAHDMFSAIYNDKSSVSMHITNICELRYIIYEKVYIDRGVARGGAHGVRAPY